MNKLEHLDITVEASLLDTIRIISGIIPEGEVINKSEISGSIANVWVNYGETNARIEELVKVLDDGKHQRMAGIITKELGLKKPIDLLKLSAELYGALGKASKLVEDELPTYMIKDELTVREGAIINLVMSLISLANVLSSYCVNVTYRILEDEQVKGRKNDIEKSTAQLRAAIKEHYGKTDKAFSDVLKISKALKISSGAAAIGDSKVKLPSANFINPIWSVRRMLVDRDKYVYDKLKLEAQLMEIRILEIKSTQTPNSEARVEYFEEKLSELDREIRDLEKDI